MMTKLVIRLLETYTRMKAKAVNVRWFLGFKISLAVFIVLHTDISFASSIDDMTIGGVAHEITKSFTDLARLITAMSYLSGLGFTLNAILKFKQHINNPTQNTIGAPIALLFVGSAFLFFPSVLGMTGQTIFAGAQTTAGPLGTIIT